MLDPAAHALLLYSALPAAAGGLTAYLLALKVGKYRNNRLVRKFSIEVVGALVTGCLLTLWLASPTYRAMLAFGLGTAWARVIEIIRDRITKVVEAALGDL